MRWIAVAAGAAVALVVAAVTIAWVTIDTQAIARYATDEVSRLTGRTVAVRGPVSIAYWPRVAVVAHDVTISNPAGASRPDLARAATIKGAVATWPLLSSRQVVAEEIEITGLDLFLESMPGGRGNWESATREAQASARATGEAEAGAPFRLGGAIAFVDANVTWRRADGATLAARVERFEVALQEGGRYAVRGRAEVDGTRWILDATTGDPFASLRDRVPLDIDAKASGGGVTLTARGRAERRDTGPHVVLDASVTWDAGSERVNRFSPELARESGRISARLDAREKRLDLSGIAGAIAGTKLDGNLAIESGAKLSRLEGRLHADLLDFARERTVTRTEGRAAPSGRDDPALVARLATFDADLDFVVDRVRVRSGIEATNARGRIVVAAGRLTVAPLDLDLAGGRITGRVSADAATGRGHVVIDGHGMELARTLGRLGAARTVSGGVARFSVDLQGPATSRERFLAGASGSISADIGPMRVQGISLDAGGEVLARVLDTLNPFRRVDQSTEMQCFVARLAVREGVAHADRSLAVETSRLLATASGTIDLGHETLDLLVRPRARKALAMPSIELAEVVRVSGPIRQPSIRLDKIGAAKTALTIGGAVATGGWSLLATPLLNAGDDPHPCATARAGVKAIAPANVSSSQSRGTEDVLAPLRGLLR